MTDTLKERIMHALHCTLEEYRKTQDPDSGRFLAENGGWAITMQDPMLCYAYLYKHKGTPYYGDETVLKIILNAVHALRQYQNPDGMMEFIKTDGSTWGPIYMPWTWYHWLETYALLKDDLTDDVRRDWEDGLMPGLEAYGRQNPEHVHNIPVWQAMTSNRAGIIFERPDWCENADKLIANCVKSQHEDGFWAEHKGPTVGYNTVYVHSLGLYRFHGGKINVLDAIRRAVRFQQAFHYPNGSEVEVIDGRVQYHWRHSDAKGVPAIGFSGFATYLMTAGGRDLINFKMHGINDFHAGAHAVSVLQLIDAGIDLDGDEGLKGFASPDFKTVYGSASITREQNKQISLSAYTAPKTDDRWGLERLCYVSYWTPDTELIMGGGNTRGQSDHATFLFRSETGGVISDMPDSAVIPEAGKLRLYYSAGTGCVDTYFERGRAVYKFYVTDLKAGVKVSVNLPLRPRYSPAKEDMKIESYAGENVISWRGVRVKFTGDYSLTDPSRPYNPYEPDGIPGAGDYSLLLSLPGGEHTVVIETD